MSHFFIAAILLIQAHERHLRRFQSYSSYCFFLKQEQPPRGALVLVKMAIYYVVSRV